MPRNRSKIPMPDGAPLWQRALAWILVGVLAGVFGTLGWVISLLLLVGGFVGVQATGLDLPTWTWVLAFAVGMPLGAWLEIRFV